MVKLLWRSLQFLHEGRQDSKDKERFGHLKIYRMRENGEKVQQLMRFDRRLNVRVIAEEMNLFKGTVRKMTPSL